MDYKDYLLQKNNRGHFWYEARKILIKNLLGFKLSQAKKESKILDIGCGTGLELDTISKFGDLFALDINEQAIEIAKKGGYKTKILNIEKIELEKDYYNAVCAFDVLEHLNDDYFAIRSIFESLKDNSYFFFTVPAHPSIFSHHDIGMEHKRRYTKKDIKEKLEAEGFKEVELYYWNFTLFPLIYIYRIFKKIFFRKSILGSEARTRKKFLNKFLFLILKFEADSFFMKKTTPGLSIYGFAKK